MRLRDLSRERSPSIALADEWAGEEKSSVSGRGEDAERRTERGREKEGKKTASNPLKYFLNPLCSAQPGKQYILRPPPERGLCNQSFLRLPLRQLVVHTGRQLGWKEGDREERKEERVTEEWGGGNMICGQSLSDDFLLHWQAAALLNNNQRAWIVWTDATIMRINGINETAGWSLVIRSDTSCLRTENQAASVCRLLLNQESPRQS